MPRFILDYHLKRLLKKNAIIFSYLILALSFLWYIISPVSCDLPKLYRIGENDVRFNYEDRKLLDAMKKAEDVWERDLGFNVLEFDAVKGLSVNLIYEDRQKRTDEIVIATEVLDLLEEKRSDINETYTELESQYYLLSTKYEQAVIEYEKQVSDFNKTIEYWNEKQGAPQDIYSVIKKEQRELEMAKVNLDLDRTVLNKIVSRLNDTSNQERNVVEKYNSIVGSFESVYGTATLFDRAEYNTESINIYEFTDEDVLVLSLIHEFGHYLGIDHVNDSSSLMYYLMQDQNVSNPKLTNADILGFNKVCPVQRGDYFGRLIIFKNYLQSIL